jgi:hypothetical protein
VRNMLLETGGKKILICSRIKTTEVVSQVIQKAELVIDLY